jgi:transcriptional regulator with AAA-type ATPase domain
MPLNMQDQLLSILDMADSQRSGPEEDGHRYPYPGGHRYGFGRNGSKAGIFSPILYDRLKLFDLTIPPLRERKDDIHPLCRYFFDQISQRAGKAGQFNFAGSYKNPG